MLCKTNPVGTVAAIAISGHLPLLLSKERYVVVLVGHTGAGVSSTVNLIARCPINPHAPDSKQHTRCIRRHYTDTPQRDISLYEIPGFGGEIPEADLMKYIVSLHKSLGIDLLLYCMRLQLKEFMPRTFQTLRRHLQGVPFVGVMTGLELYPVTMAEWWTRLPDSRESGVRSNKEALKSRGLEFDDHAGITTLPEKIIATNEKLLKRREKSEADMLTLIDRHCNAEKRSGSGGPCRRYLAVLSMRSRAVITLH
ncbi:hypothetical protein ID866_10824 [Astraeus odoratus]|nr:hypothetical protein ID866_10824 [Astraeus odoratus]